MGYKITIKFDSETRILTLDDDGVLSTSDTMSININLATAFVSTVHEIANLMQKLGFHSFEIEEA